MAEKYHGLFGSYDDLKGEAITFTVKDVKIEPAWDIRWFESPEMTRQANTVMADWSDDFRRIWEESGPLAPRVDPTHLTVGSYEAIIDTFERERREGRVRRPRT